MDFENAPVTKIGPANMRPQPLTPETMVDVINRGFETLVRKYDSHDYELPPHTEGLFQIPYGCALHFQKHTTVPGTRDVGSGVEQSYLGIVRNATNGQLIDPPEFCEPFTEEQCRQFGQRIEAVARSSDDPVQTVSVSSMTASGRVPVGRQSTGRRRMQREGVGNVADALAPPEGPNEAQEEINQDSAEYAETGGR